MQDGHVIYADPLAADFRNFLAVLWSHLGLPSPTPAQYEIAYRMQHGNPETYNPLVGRADIIEAFRGVGKSYIAGGYCLWRLYRDPVNEKILVVSASSIKAKEFVSQVKNVLMTWDVVEHLRPGPNQRDSFDRFDVAGASISQSPSLKAAGITGQITGSRSTLTMADDIEIPANSRTEESRALLLSYCLEFESIKVPALVDADGNVVRPAGDVIFLGTPQTAESIYTKLIKERGFQCFCWTARYPQEDKRENYILKRDDGTTIDILAPPLARRLEENPSLAGRPTDPQRFGEDDLLAREAKGRSNFLLQFMLDTTLSDAERYPLKQNDLIVFNCNAMKAPMTLQWGRHSDGINVRSDIPNVGFTGDQFLGPLFQDREWREYQGSVLFVDPAGRGKDETAWAIVKVLNGMMFALKVDGFVGDVNEGYLRIAQDAKAYNVNLILIEPNFAPGVWIAGFQPVLQKVWPATRKTREGKEVAIPGEVGGCTVEEAEWARGRKEERIIDTLEPVMNTHRLVVDESVARDETLMYQLTHITRDRNSLSHDDRLDALAGAVSHFTRVMEIDTDKAKREMEAEELDRMLEDFVETCTGWPGMFRRGRGRRPDIEVYQFN